MRTTLRVSDRAPSDVQQLAETYADTGDLDLRGPVVSGCRRWSEPMARATARRSRVEADDLCQVAALAVLAALERYDPGAGRFEPFARVTVSGELRHHLRAVCWPLRVSRRHQDAWRSLAAAREELARGGNAEPSLAEVASAAGLSLADAAVTAALPRRTDPLDAEVPSRGAGVAWHEDEVERATDVIDLRRALATLASEDRRLIDLYFGAGLSQKRVAELVGCSQITVSRRLAGALVVLRRVLPGPPTGLVPATC